MPQKSMKDSPSMAHTYTVIYIAQDELQQLVGENASRIRETE